ncbi:MAG: MoaD/ThiS family protein [Deltaproteobacteria bacterium]|uniref:MoaD/ThiS family protein n=1 Tax=Candidatus Zymogenus saltonus TaxID=2844893 RepID=A0A9D8PN28_9DELT|nr:MoaD/ThiS family protein [Candidatus Zymogenus saltonus]
MKVEVKLFAGFRKHTPEEAQNSFFMDVPHGSTVGDIVASLGLPADVKKIIFVNGVHGDSTTSLKSNDRVGIFPPVAGG